MNLGQQIQLKDITIMKDICQICMTDFTSHSFNYIGHTLEGGHIFYTKIANSSKYDDAEGITQHCTNYLNYINPDKWSWIIDFDEFSLRHTLGLNTGIQLSRLVNKFGRLNHIIALNTNTFVEQMLKIIKLTLRSEYHNCIRVLHPNDAFSKEMEQWSGGANDLLKQLLHQSRGLSSPNKQ